MPTVLVVSLFLGLAVAKDDTKGKATLIQGTWKVVSFQEAGRKDPPPPGAFEKMGMRIVISKDKYTVKTKEMTDAKTYRLDPSKSPKWFDLEGVKAPGGVEIGPNLGIYELNGEELKICLGRSGKARPTAFDPTNDPAADVLLILKREKP
jgi:uncharacterized protein (TIGR03067 family)